MSGIPSWAVRGAKVVCIRKSETCTRGAAGLPEPIVGEVYTLDGWARAVELGVWVGIAELSEKSCFKLELFRPLVTRSQEQDIATHFRDLLRQPEVERA